MTDEVENPAPEHPKRIQSELAGLRLARIGRRLDLVDVAS
jgi:hypothetical protein